MSLFPRRPLRGLFLLRRLIVEFRGIRRALERQADALELSALPQASTPQGQVFRSYSRTKGDLSPREMQEVSSVTYVDNRVLAGMLAKEDELRVILGRDPTEEEIERAYQGVEP